MLLRCKQVNCYLWQWLPLPFHLAIPANYSCSEQRSWWQGITWRNCRFGRHLSSDRNLVCFDVPFSGCKTHIAMETRHQNIAQKATFVLHKQLTLILQQKKIKTESVQRNRKETNCSVDVVNKKKNWHWYKQLKNYIPWKAIVVPKMLAVTELTVSQYICMLISSLDN